MCGLQHIHLSPQTIFDLMERTNPLNEFKARECALMAELESAKTALREAEKGKREALAELESANREKEAVTLLAESLRRELDTLRASTSGTASGAAIELAVKERFQREMVESKHRRDWLRSPEGSLYVLTITAQNGFSAKGFKNLSRAFRYDEQLWDAIKDRRGPNGVTHLMVAAQRGDLERVRWLLKRSANVNADATREGFTALMWAGQENRLDVARLLIDKGADVNALKTLAGTSVLMLASARGHLEMVRLLILKGAHVNTAQSSDGMTALMWACGHGHLEVARLLVDESAEGVNLAQTKGGYTALMWASERGRLEIARLLLDKGACVDASTGDGSTALALAVRKAQLKVVCLLIGRSAQCGMHS